MAGPPASLPLRRQIEEPDIVIAPGVYDVATARLVEKAGFSCAYMTGAGVSMAATGFPDVGMISFAEVLDRVGHIADNLDLPLIADADTGFGGALNVVRTVREYERRGAAAIQLEDQADPKKCGHELGRRCVSAQEMSSKLKAALDTRASEDFLVIARTDARTSEGLDSAIDRAGEYARAGADVLFIESLESAEEMAKARAALDRPLLANMVEGGRSPLLPAKALQEIGYDMVIYPNSILRTVCKQVEAMLTHLHAAGSTDEWLGDMYSHGQLWGLFGHDAWVAREREYTGPPSVSVG